MALADLSDDDIQQLMDAGVIKDKNDLLNMQLKQATALRNAPLPGGRDSGKVFTAASPLEMLAGGLQRRQAMGQMGNIQQQQTDLLNKLAAARGLYGSAIGGRKPPVSGGTTTNFDPTGETTYFGD